MFNQSIMDLGFDEIQVIKYPFNSIENNTCHNPTLRKCEDETHTPEMGTWESSETPKTSEFNCRGQNTLH
jgi:hypothetical protein